MAPRVLSDAELEALTSWPPEIAHSDLAEYFTLDVGDFRWVRSHRGAATRLGLAVQLCALRFLGRAPPAERASGRSGYGGRTPKWLSELPGAESD